MLIFQNLCKVRSFSGLIEPVHTYLPIWEFCSWLISWQRNSIHLCNCVLGMGVDHPVWTWQMSPCMTIWLCQLLNRFDWWGTTKAAPWPQRSSISSKEPCQTGAEAALLGYTCLWSRHQDSHEAGRTVVVISVVINDARCGLDLKRIVLCQSSSLTMCHCVAMKEIHHWGKYMVSIDLYIGTCDLLKWEV